MYLASTSPNLRRLNTPANHDRRLHSGDDDPRRNIVRNTISGYVRQAIETVVFLAITPFLIKTIGVDSFGLWSAVWAVMSLLMLLDLGVGPAVMKLVADARGTHDFDAHQRSVATIFWLYVVQAGVVGLLAYGCVHFSSVIFPKLSATELAQAESMLLILGSSVALVMPLSIFRGIFAGHQQVRFVNYYEATGTIVYFCLVLFALPHFESLEALAAMNAGSMVLGFVLIAIHGKIALPGTSLRFKFVDWSLIPKLWSYSLFFMLAAVASVIATRVDTLIVERVFDLRAVMLYTVAIRVTSKASQVGVQISHSLSSVVAEMAGSGDDAGLRKVWLRGSRVSAALAFPLIVGLAVLAEPLLVCWISEEAAEAAPLVQILAGAAMVLVIHSTSQQLLAMRGQQRPLAFIVLGGQAVNLSLSVALARPLGLKGVAVATLLVSLIEGSVIILGMVTRANQSTRREFYRVTVVPCLVPVAVMLVAMQVWMHMHPISSLIEVGFVEAGGIFLFGALYWHLSMSEEEREAARAKVERRLRRK